MIVLDISALFAVAASEPRSAVCLEVLKLNRGAMYISAVTMAECMIVAGGRGIAEDMRRLLSELDPQVAAVTVEVAESVSRAYLKWGKGFHPARLNFCDCFAYVLAKDRDLPLLFIGDDFSRTDIRSALASAAR